MKLVLQPPVSYVKINQRFGNVAPMYTKIGLKGHNGIDYYAPDGTPVMAAHDGTIVYAGLDGSNGNLLVIMSDAMYDHDGGQAFVKTLYGHLKTGKIFVTVGVKVKAGQVIAHADNTGMSTGSHLHFGMKWVEKGEENWLFWNINQDNGYNGASDPAPYLPPFLDFNVDLRHGDTGEEVEKMQAFLLRGGYMNPVDKLGYYGNLTASALLKFQIANVPNLSWYERYVLKGTRFGAKSRAVMNALT